LRGRRDFTINSLFYRVDSGAVEDFTGRGLADLDAQLIRTPLPAAETFMDGARGPCGGAGGAPARPHAFL
jgi:hypothetical protein